MTGPPEPRPPPLKELREGQIPRPPPDEDVASMAAAERLLYRVCDWLSAKAGGIRLALFVVSLVTAVVGFWTGSAAPAFIGIAAAWITFPRPTDREDRLKAWDRFGDVALFAVDPALALELGCRFAKADVTRHDQVEGVHRFRVRDGPEFSLPLGHPLTGPWDPPRGGSGVPRKGPPPETRSGESRSLTRLRDEVSKVPIPNAVRRDLMTLWTGAFVRLREEYPDAYMDVRSDGRGLLTLTVWASSVPAGIIESWVLTEGSFSALPTQLWSADEQNPLRESS